MFSAMRRQGCLTISRECQDEGDSEGQPNRFLFARYFLSPAFCFAALLSIFIFTAVSSSETNNRESGTSPDELSHHASRIDGVAFSPDGRFGASASSDCVMKVWEFATRRQETVAISSINGFSGVAFSPDGRTLASGTRDGRFFLAELKAGRPARSFKANETEGSVRVVVFSPDGGSLATGGDDRAVHVWDVPSGRERLIMRGHDAWVSGLAYTSDGETILSVSGDGRAISWDARSGHVRERVEGGCGPLFSIAVSENGRWAALGGRDGIALRNLQDGRSQVYRCSQVAFSSLGFLPGGTSLASASLEGTIMLWKVEGEGLRPWRTLVHQASPVTALAVSHDGESLLTGGNEGILRSWSLKDYR
jgi:WD40 repeat protein